MQAGAPLASRSGQTACRPVLTQGRLGLPRLEKPARRETRRGRSIVERRFRVLRLRICCSATASSSGQSQESQPPATPLSATLGRLVTLVRDDAWVFAGAISGMFVAAGAELLIPHQMTAAVFAATQSADRASFHTALTTFLVSTC